MARNLDHVDGDSPMARLLPSLALAFGADLVEKHITLDRKAKGFDYQSALEPGPFGEMVELLRQSNKAFGSEAAVREAGAERYHRMMRRAVLSRETLPRGVPVEAGQLALLRCDRGIAPKEAPRLVARRPRREIAAWQPLTEELFE